MVEIDLIIASFARRALLSHEDIMRLESVLATIDKMDDFQHLYGRCASVDDDLTIPFVNRNLLISKNMWQATYQRLLAADATPKEEPNAR